MAIRGLLDATTAETPQVSAPMASGGLLAQPGGPDDPQRTVGEWFGSMIMNIPGSGAQFMGDIVGLLRPSTWQALWQLKDDPAMQAEVLDYMKQRYGGVDNVLESIRTDPVGMFGDVVGAVSGGSLLAGKLAASGSKVARVANAAGNVADMVDPLNLAVRGAKTTATDIIPGISASMAGVSPATVKQWFRTGLQGGEAQTNFNRIIANLSLTDMGNIANRLRNGLNEVRLKRNADYRDAMASLGAAEESISLKPLVQKLDELESGRTATDAAGKNVWLPNDPREGVLSQIRGMVKAMEGLPPTIDNIDKLKQAINTLYSPTDPGASQIVTEAYNLVKDQIAEQAPRYTEIMQDYSSASDAIFALEREFRLQNQTPDTSIFSRALSTTRDQVNTHFGGRHQLLQQLDEGVFSDIAAAAGNPTTPTGLRQQGSGLYGLTQGAEYLSTGDPTNLLGATLPYAGMIPRVHARGANILGQTAGLPNRIPQVRNVLDRARRAGAQNVPSIPGRFTGPRNPFSPASYQNPTRGAPTVGEWPYRVGTNTARALRPLMTPVLNPRTEDQPIQPPVDTGRRLEDLTPEEKEALEKLLYGSGGSGR